MTKRQEELLAVMDAFMKDTGLSVEREVMEDMLSEGRSPQVVSFLLRWHYSVETIEALAEKMRQEGRLKAI